MRTLNMFVIAVALLATSTTGARAQLAGDAASRPPIPSAGCGISPVEPGEQPSNQLDVGRVSRDWAMHVPEAHDGQRPVPVWLYLHGSGGSRSEGITIVADTAEEHGFVLVSPQTLPGRKWNRKKLATTSP